MKQRAGILALFLAALAFSINGIVSKLVLEAGLSPLRFAEVRSTGAFAFFLIYLLIFKRSALRFDIKALPEMLVYGIVGYAGVQFFYFVAILRMPVSVGLIIEFTAPIWILVFLRFILKKHVPNGLWYAIVLALGGLLMITQIWNGLTLDRVGLMAAFFDAFCLAGYFLIGDHLSKTKSSGAISVWGFGVASFALLFFFPIWDYPFEALSKDMNLLGVFEGQTLPGWVLVLWIIIMGTLAPYLFVLAGLKILSASTASVFGMIEPVLAGMIAWWWLSESLNGIQLIGCVVVIVGIVIADRARQHATN